MVRGGEGSVDDLKISLITEMNKKKKVSTAAVVVVEWWYGQGYG